MTRALVLPSFVRSAAPALVAVGIACCLLSFAPHARAAAPDLAANTLNDFITAPQDGTTAGDAMPIAAPVAPVAALAGTTSPGTALTQEQLANVQSLLASYGVPQQRINAVSAVLMDAKLDPNGPAGRPATASSTNCLAPLRALVKGMRSNDVATLQDRLIDDGYLSEDSATGYFGNATESALKQWQADQGIVATGTPETTGWGSVGKKTLQALAACVMHNAQNSINTLDNRAPSSTPARPLTPPSAPVAPVGSTSVPSMLQGIDDSQGAAAATAQFLADYSDAFNRNLAAVVAAPFNLAINLLSGYFNAIGIQ